MKQLKTGKLIQKSSELPNWKNAKELFLDVETSGLRLYHGDFVCGIACAINEEEPIYIPLNHPDCKVNATEWLKDVVSTSQVWINHNIKFDAHACAILDAVFTGKLVDTLTMAKVYDSDQFVYDLGSCVKRNLDRDSSWKKSIDIKAIHEETSTDAGTYACEDIINTRDLYRFFCYRIPEQCHKVLETEVLLTPVLWDMEREGMRVDPTELKKWEFVLRNELLSIEEKIDKTVGTSINPTSNDSCFDLLCTHWDLPILGRTDKGEPSFDAPTLRHYLELDLSEKQRVVIEDILNYRTKSTQLSMFVVPYQEHEVNGLLHPDYNQSVKSGRLSCRRPNAQQLNKFAKQLIHCKDGEAFGSYDYSQVEFRFIVHYIKDSAAIQAYADNPDTDFHQWVADITGMNRRPAKNVNFAMAFGGGEDRIVTMLANDESLVSGIDISAIPPEERQEYYNRECRRRGKTAYDVYHAKLPGIRQTAKRASRVAGYRGFVFNAYGRRLHLSRRGTYKAFNRIIQSSAADLMKERLIALSPRYNTETKNRGLRLVANVHDEVLLTGKQSAIKESTSFIKRVLESPSIELTVPIKVDSAMSTTTWADCQ